MGNQIPPFHFITLVPLSTHTRLEHAVYKAAALVIHTIHTPLVAYTILTWNMRMYVIALVAHAVLSWNMSSANQEARVTHTVHNSLHGDRNTLVTCAVLAWNMRTCAVSTGVHSSTKML